MTRVLAELLRAREPGFHQSLLRLEGVSGHTNADIRLTTEIERATKARIRVLGLDPNDTTGEELYAALQQRFKADDALLSAQLRKVYGDDRAAHVAISEAIMALPLSRSCFALKTVVGRKLLKKLPPKHTMKLLGYRSVDSLLRREQLLAVLAVAWLVEPAHWRKSMLETYRKLTAADFEIRSLIVVSPQSKHWQAVADTVVAQNKHNIVALREYGAVVVLPFPDSAPPAAALTALLLALHEVNTVRACSTYLKLYQVRPDFGDYVKAVACGEPTLVTSVLDSPVDWHVVQRYYARFGDRFREDLFAPHIQRDDMTWYSIEKALSLIDPKLTFWHNTGSLGMTTVRGPVSLNVIDTALSYCNSLPYRSRSTDYLQQSLWGELIIRYLKHDAVEQAVL
jgi:hypothetical protein